MVPSASALLCGGGACNGQPLLFQLLQQSGIFGGGQFVRPESRPIQRWAYSCPAGFRPPPPSASGWGLDREGGGPSPAHRQNSLPGQDCFWNRRREQAGPVCRAQRYPPPARLPQTQWNPGRLPVLVGLGCIGRGGGVLLNAVHVGLQRPLLGPQFCMGFRMVRHSGAAGAGQAGDGQHHDGTAGGQGGSVFAHRGLRRFRGGVRPDGAITPAAKPSGTGVSSASGNASRMASAAWT